VLLVGIDWAERHHDVCLMAADGSVLARERIADGVAGVARLHELIAGHASDPAEVVVGIETDRGLLVGALVGAGYQVIAVNPLAASRYRERHTISGAKSDRGDARMLADLVRTDRHHHRPAKGDSGLAEAVKVLARGHQQLVWNLWVPKPVHLMRPGHIRGSARRRDPASRPVRRPLEQVVG
jgi:Transposase